MNIVERVMLLSDISCMPSFHLRWRSPLSSASVNTWISSATRHASMCIYIYISYYYPLLNEADYTFTCGAWQYLSGDADYNNLPIFPNVGDGWKTFPRGHLIYNFSSLWMYIWLAIPIIQPKIALCCCTWQLVWRCTSSKLRLKILVGKMIGLKS